MQTSALSVTHSSPTLSRTYAHLPRFFKPLPVCTVYDVNLKQESSINKVFSSMKQSSSKINPPFS